MSAFGSASADVAAIARYGLTDQPHRRMVDDAGADLLHQLREHRILGLGVRAIDDRWLEVPEDIDARLRDEHAGVMARCLELEVRLLDIVDMLDGAGISYRVLKGPALAHTSAVDPADRAFRDLDLLVPASRIDDAVAAIGRLGGTRLQPQLRPDFDRRFAKSVTMRLDDLEVDLHRTLAPGPFGMLARPAELFVVRELFDVGGHELATLDATDHLLHACYHAALGQGTPVLVNLRDIVLLARDPSVDVARLADTVRRWDGRAVMARAVALVDELLDMRLDELGAAFPADPGDEDRLAPYLREGDRFAGLALATLRMLPFGDRLAFARAVGLPDGVSARDRLRSLADRKRWRELGRG